MCVLPIFAASGPAVRSAAADGAGPGAGAAGRQGPRRATDSREIGRASCRERGEISGGLELRCVFFRSLRHQAPRSAAPPRTAQAPVQALLDAKVRDGQLTAERSEERRVGKEGRYRGDWS